MKGERDFGTHYFSHDAIAPSGPQPPHNRGFTITLSHTTLGTTPLSEWSGRRRDFWQHTALTSDRYPYPGGIRTRNSSKRAAADPRLRPHGHWDRLRTQLTLILRLSRTGTVWFYTSTSNKRAARPKLYTKSLTRDLKHMYSRLTLMRISIKL